MASLNKVFLIGRLVADPELSHTQNGTPFTRFRIAVNRPYRDRSGNWQEDTVFIDIVVWGEAADRAVSRFNKGTRVLVEGRLQQRSWETESGEKRSKIEVRAERVVALDPRRELDENIEEIDDIEF
ncbi:MAG: single-stranded DNA-binding protein [Desulfurobacteriaceae bacterium]